MTYELETLPSGTASLAQVDNGEQTPSPSVGSIPMSATGFDLNNPSQRFLAGRSWLAEGDASFLQEVQNLKDHGWLPNDRNEHGDALLHVAVRSARWSSVTWLMNNGADPFLTNNHGHTSVWLARRRPLRQLPEAFKALVEKAKSEGLLDEPLPSQEARPVRTKSVKTKTAVPAVVEPSPKSTKDRAPRHAKVPVVKPVREPRRPAAASEVLTSAQAQRFTEALAGDDRATLMQLLAEGFDMSSHNEAGNTVLHEALARNAWEWTDRLINYGAPLSAPDRTGKTVLTHLENRWAAQDPAIDMERYETFQDAIADEKALQRVALGQGITRSTKSLFQEKVGLDIDWKGLPEDPDRPARAVRPNSKTNRPQTSKPSSGFAGKPSKPKSKSGRSTGAASRPSLGKTSFSGKPARKNGGQPNPLVTGVGQGARRSSLDRPLRDVSEYSTPKGATLAPNIVIVRKARRTLMKP